MCKLLSVNNLPRVKELGSFDNLLEVALHFDLCKSFPSLEQVIEGLVSAQLYYYINVVFVLERAFELDYMLTARLSNTPE